MAQKGGISAQRILSNIGNTGDISRYALIVQASALCALYSVIIQLSVYLHLLPDGYGVFQTILLLNCNLRFQQSPHEI